MIFLCSILRRFSTVVLVNNQNTFFSNLKAACNYKSPYFGNSVRSHPYCTQLEYWPSNLPPATEWGYDKPGPDTWPSKYPSADGKNQSPIDIITSLVKSADFENPLKWKYASGICKSIINTGCGWRVDVDGRNTELSGGPLTNNYELVQFHCHWGNCSSCGSEHTVDGKSYSAELHFVHWNKDQFSSCAEAIPSPNGLTVIGVFLEVGEQNSEIEKLCNLIGNIPKRDQRVDLETDINPVLMYPDDTAYWTYSGSLTTPPCYESVNWIVFKNPITISEEQLICFRNMKKPSNSENDDPGCVDHNYRPPQPLNDREICEAIC